MKAYWFIIRNSFKENNQSITTLAISLLQPGILIAGYFMFYNYITRDLHNGINTEFIIYYLFIVMIATLDIPRLGTYIQGDIQTEKYILIDRLPMKPFNFYFMHSIGKSGGALMLYAVIVQAYLIYLQTPITIQLAFIPAVILAFVVGHLITFCTATTAFYFENMHMWFFSIIFEFTSGKMIPLALMPPALSFFFTWLTPFGYAAGTLARYLGTQDYGSLALAGVIAMLWVVVLYWATNIFWNKGSFYFQEYNG